MKIVATREHEFAYGHRVAGHENKCANLHGHNAKVIFFVEASEDCDALDNLGRVIDFSVIKDKLCMWLENNWDHKMLMWQDDPIQGYMPTNSGKVLVPFNPTAENMAKHLLYVIGPRAFSGYGVRLVKVVFYETSKCMVEVSL